MNEETHAPKGRALLCAGLAIAFFSVSLGQLKSGYHLTAIYPSHAVLLNQV